MVDCVLELSQWHIILYSLADEEASDHEHKRDRQLD